MATENMIPSLFTVTLNPCFDLTLTLDHLIPEDVSRTLNETCEPAGKGISVSRMLRNLGCSVDTFILAGVQDTERFTALLGDMAGRAHIIPCAGGIRENLTLCPPGPSYKINRPPPAPGNRSAPTALEGLLDLSNQLTKLLHAGDIVILSGSLPPGIASKDFIALCRALSDAGARLAIDCDMLSINDLEVIKPWLIKPNDFELQRLTGADHIDAGLLMLDRLDIPYVLLSLGSKGVRLHRANHPDIVAPAPRVEVKSTVCAGDCVTAGFITSLINGCALDYCVYFAMACGTVAVTKSGSGIGTLDEAKARLSEMAVI